MSYYFGRSNGPTKCRICCKTFSHRGSLDCHLRCTPCGSSIRKFQCSYCKNNYMSEGNLEDHKLKYHMNQRSKSNDASGSNDATANSKEKKDSATNATNETEPREPRSSTESSGQQSSDPAIFVDLTIDSEEEGATPAQKVTPQVEKPAKKLKRKNSMTSTSSGQSSSSGVSSVAESERRKCQRRDSETTSHCSNDSNGPEAQNSSQQQNRSSSISSERPIKQEQFTDEFAGEQASDIVGGAHGSSFNESGSATTTNVTEESSSLRQKKLEEIESERRTLERDRKETQLQLKLIEIDKKDEELVKKQNRLKSG